MTVRGTQINKYGRSYINGRAMGEERITRVIESYTFLLNQADGGNVPVSHIANAANVSWRVAKRVVLKVNAGIGDSRAGWFQIDVLMLVHR